MIEPVEELTAICKKQNCVVMIDGAHAPGVLDIDVNTIGADLYTGNCHKWLFAPKGCAFMWVSEAFRAQFTNCPQPAIISSTGWYDYVGRFAYTGTRDYTAFCTLSASLKFIDEVLGGMEPMRQYCRQLLRDGCDYLVKEWNTSYLVPYDMHGVMANVILPVQSLALANQLQKRLHKERNMFIVVGAVPRASNSGNDIDVCTDIVFVRISAQVYLEFQDFQLLVEAVAEILPTCTMEA